MKIKSLITWPKNCGEGVIEGRIYDVVDSSHYPEQVGVMSEDKTCLTWLSQNYHGVQEFELVKNFMDYDTYVRKLSDVCPVYDVIWKGEER